MKEYRYIYKRNPNKPLGYELIGRFNSVEEVSKQVQFEVTQNKIPASHVLICGERLLIKHLFGEGCDYDVGV